MKIIKQLKKASMGNNKKIKKNLSKKIDKKILKALKERFLKAKKEMKEAKNAYKTAKEFFDKKTKNKPNRPKSSSKAKTKKTDSNKVTAPKKPKSNARVTTLDKLEPTTSKKPIKRLPKALRVKKSKTNTKKRKTTLPKKVALKKTILKVVDPAPKKVKVTKKLIPKKVVSSVKPATKKNIPKIVVAKKTTPKKIVSSVKPATKKSIPKKVVKVSSEDVPFTLSKKITRTSKTAAKKKPTTQKRIVTQTQLENLKIVEGIGPAIEKLLKSKGINTVSDLSKTRIGVLRNILEEAGGRFKIHKPDTWARQARFAARGKFNELKEWQKELDGGKK